MSILYQVEQKNMDFFTILVIQDLNSMHSGEYSCKATNDFGTVSHSAALIVKGIYLQYICILWSFNKYS